MVDRNLYNLFIELGIRKEGIVLVSSDIVRFWSSYRRVKPDFRPDDILDTLMEIVTPSGTLLFPTYNWDFCSGIPFDYTKTKSKSGALGDIALNKAGFKRTKHPIYSFAVWGNDQDSLAALDNASAFGEDSPFAYLHQHQGCNLVIGIDFNHCFTFAHYVEECLKVPYRFLKNFSAAYIDSDNNQSEKTYKMFVRHLDLDVINVPDINELIDTYVVKKRLDYQDTYFKSLDFQKAYEVIAQDIELNKGRNIVSYKGQ